MTFLGILLTLLLALLVGSLFYYVFKSSGPWGSFWSFLLILVLAGLAASFWVNPVGPVFWDIAWVPTLFVILIFALLLAAASPPYERREAPSSEERPSEEESAAIAFGGFFWVLMSLLLILALWGAFV